jgi:hypothetical protein
MKQKLKKSREKNKQGPAATANDEEPEEETKDVRKIAAASAEAA